MDCYCEEPPEFYSSATRKARKQHRCCECCRMIQPGEQYEAASGKWDGQVDTFRTCAHCVDLREYVDIMLKTIGECWCWAHSGLTAELSDWIRDYDNIPGFQFGVGRRLVKIKRAKREQQRMAA